MPSINATTYNIHMYTCTHVTFFISRPAGRFLWTSGKRNELVSLPGCLFSRLFILYKRFLLRHLWKQAKYLHYPQCV